MEEGKCTRMTQLKAQGMPSIHCRCILQLVCQLGKRMEKVSGIFFPTTRCTTLLYSKPAAIHVHARICTLTAYIRATYVLCSPKVGTSKKNGLGQYQASVRSIPGGKEKYCQHKDRPFFPWEKLVNSTSFAISFSRPDCIKPQQDLNDDKYAVQHRKGGGKGAATLFHDTPTVCIALPNDGPCSTTVPSCWDSLSALINRLLV